jgi:hypothetical protein
MQVQRIDNMFSFTFQKSSAEIVEKATAKANSIRAKIGERERRLAKVRAEYKITDAAIIDLLQRARSAAGNAMANYSTSVRDEEGHIEEVTIGAGVINLLLTENDFIEGEKTQVDRLDTIAKHLTDVVVIQNGTAVIQKQHPLSYAELKFLGF